MRRRWFWFVLAAFLVASFTLFLVPRKPDGLDFIRKYHPREERLLTYPSHYVVSGSTPPIMLWEREFSFDSLPPRLIREMEGMMEPGFDTSLDIAFLPNESSLTWSKVQSKVWVQLAIEPSWLETQWRSLINRLFPPPALMDPTFQFQLDRAHVDMVGDRKVKQFKDEQTSPETADGK